jgi:hypothetical protein
VDALDVDEPLEQAPTATASPTAASDVSTVRLSRRDQGHLGADPLKVLRAIATSTTWFSRLPAVTAGGQQSSMSTIYRAEDEARGEIPFADGSATRLTDHELHVSSIIRAGVSSSRQDHKTAYFQNIRQLLDDISEKFRFVGILEVKMSSIYLVHHVMYG